jgi:pimeloyl-ACP methyl ester carboxylesterase
MRPLISINKNIFFQSVVRPHKQATWLRNLTSECSSDAAASMSSAIAQNETDSQFMLLPDGRTLGFSEYGPESGYPVLYFHGYPSSRLEVSAVAKIAHRRGIRFFGLDRPGFGLSTYAPNRKIMDWPQDVKAFANHVGLKKFAVMGGSGGGPYALACAQGLPKEIMSVVGLFASAVPWDRDGYHDVSWARYFTYLAAHYTPWTFKVAGDGIVGSTRWLVTTTWAKRWIDSLLEGMANKEKEDWEKKGGEDGVTSSRGTPDDYENKPIPQRREEAIKIIMEAFRQGAQPTVQEAVLLTTDWGIKFEEVDFNPILIWHGTNDTNASMRMAKWMADRLPHSYLKEYEGVDHYQIVNYLEEIVAELVTDEMIAEWKER